MPEPLAEYQSRLESHNAKARDEERQHLRIGRLKLALFCLGAALLCLYLLKRGFFGYAFAFVVVLYVGLALFHTRILAGRDRARTAAQYYEQGIRRIEDRWAGHGSPGNVFRDAKHVYSEDLDLFGAGSLFELLSTARLFMGEQRLADWLRFPSAIEAILERQTLVTELRLSIDLREDLAVAGENLRPRFDPESVIQWAEREPALAFGWGLRSVAIALAVAAGLTLFHCVTTGDYWPLVAILALEALLYATFHKRANEAISKLNCNAEGMQLFAQILSRLERESFASTSLKTRISGLKSDACLASQAVRKLARIVNWIDGRDGLIVKIIEVPALYTFQTALAAEAWRKTFGQHLRRWVDAVAEMEALLSLAAYSFEHPDDPFPTLEPAEALACFVGEELKHPLIPSKQSVSNSVRLDASVRALLVSGSNMSGKSTLLRTVGVNAVLAFAGAPIRGKSLRLSAVTLGTRLRSADSLQENRSTFYTELLRIHQIFKLLDGKAPVLFLFDELLDGTNSRDRRIGAENILRTFLDRKAIGLVTTHDLAVTEIAQCLGERARNVHFEDSVEHGQMRFDYKLREGVVSKSNALELMRIVGLKV